LPKVKLDTRMEAPRIHGEHDAVKLEVSGESEQETSSHHPSDGRVMANT
jgi:hypothetical protein